MNGSKEVVITSYSQSHVLRYRMDEAGLRHGDTVNADINNVRLEDHFGKSVIYFCPAQSVNVLEKVAEGDNAPLPLDATTKGLKAEVFFAPGLYNLKNVTLHSNGTMQVIANENTVFEPADKDTARENELRRKGIQAQTTHALDELLGMVRPSAMDLFR